MAVNGGEVCSSEKLWGARKRASERAIERMEWNEISEITFRRQASAC